MIGVAKRDLIKGILAGDREPVNRAERRVWARRAAGDARRGRRARARVERGIRADAMRGRAADARAAVAA